MSTTQKGAAHERVAFRLLHMQCCQVLLCWVNPRFPNYCPECGKYCYPDVKGWVSAEDGYAILSTRVQKVLR